jgi:hypothetical protein
LQPKRICGILTLDNYFVAFYRQDLERGSLFVEAQELIGVVNLLLLEAVNYK